MKELALASLIGLAAAAVGCDDGGRRADAGSGRDAGADDGGGDAGDGGSCERTCSGPGECGTFLCTCSMIEGTNPCVEGCCEPFDCGCDM